MEDCLFCKIVRRQSAAAIVKEDDRALAFRDINPQAPTHILVIPKEHISGLDRTRPEHEALLGHLLLTAHALAQELGLNAGYRVVVNNGSGAGQSVFHLHLHLLGGRPFRWPPG
jgi:histidine triad (HIT) family protein